MSGSSEARLTIVLTLKDRPDFTRRWMRYMDNQRCPYRILIADGGADTEMEAWLRDAANCRNLTYEYIRYPLDRDWRQFYTKQLDACSRVATEFLLLADNDDFYLLDEIPALIRYLDDHPDYVGCRGGIGYFSLLTKDGDTVNAATGFNYLASAHESRSIDEEQFVERAECYFNGLVQYSHQMNWYCVYRRDAVVRSLKAVYKYEFADVVINEALLLLTLLAEGRVKVLDRLSYLRQMGSSQAEATLLAERNVLELFLINDAFHDFVKYMQCEWKITDEGARVRILKALARYIGTLCNTSLGYAGPGLRQRLIRRGRQLVKGHRRSSQIAYWLLSRYSHVLRGTRRMRAIRVPQIEAFILDGRENRQ